MSCLHPYNSKNYKFCIVCSSKYLCEYSTVPLPKMPEVKPPKDDISKIEKAIKLLIDNGYKVSR